MFNFGQGHIIDRHLDSSNPMLNNVFRAYVMSAFLLCDQIVFVSNLCDINKRLIVKQALVLETFWLDKVVYVFDPRQPPNVPYSVMLKMWSKNTIHLCP